MLLCLVALFAPSYYAQVSIDTSKVLNVFTPQEALGAGIDGQEKGDIERSLTPHNVELMSSAGLKSLSYRLRTELGIEAFHWNPVGVWSDPTDRCGYWTSSSTSDSPILKCYGYKLPRRGNTIDQANNDGYSRLDDGDLSSYWKSNPYLDPAYTGEDESAHPQWVVIDLGRPMPVNTLKVFWAAPYATSYQVEYWKGDNRNVGFGQVGQWLAACNPVVEGRGGVEVLRLGCNSKVRFVRLWLLESSHTAMPITHPDKRDSLGFAIREIELGWQGNSRFDDWIRHRSNRRQTVIYTSSTDPWHRQIDLDPRIEQPGFDRVAQSGLTNHQPLLVAVPCLYDTPENAAAEVAYLVSRHIPLKGIEIGEEPDGQCASPDDYAALYLQIASAIRKIDSHTPIGGPSLQTIELDYLEWPEPAKKLCWVGRLERFLRARHAEGLFQFLSFEWYPFDDLTENVEGQLMASRGFLSDALNRLAREGAPENIPWYMSEYGYSAFAGPQEDDLPGAILDVDTVGTFLERGGAAAYLYGYEPNVPINEQEDSWGNLMIIEADDSGAGRYLLPAYYAAKMVSQDWCGGESGSHKLVKTTLDGDGARWLSSYAMLRPNGSVSLLLLNKSHSRAVSFSVLENGLRWSRTNQVQYSPKQFKWHADKENGRPAYSFPPDRSRAGGLISLPPFSITVVTQRKD